VSHAVLIDRDAPGRWTRPVEVMASYLDQLDAAPTPVPKEERCLAALGPRMLALARDRSAGSHPYLSPVAHTRLARGVLGEGPLLMPELPVVTEEDPARARAVARAHMAYAARLPNYQRNLLRSGLIEDDLGEELSDRLVDAVVAWGSPEAIARRVGEHLEAGADHVAVHVAGAAQGELPREQWRRLAPAVLAAGGG